MRIALELAPGTVSDETNYSATGSYIDNKNVRFWRGKPETIGGWTAFTDDVLTGICRGVLPWSDRFGRVNVAFGTNTHLFVSRLGEMADITPSGLLDGTVDTTLYDGGYGSAGYGRGAYDVGLVEETARSWSLVNWGEALIASPSGGGIYLWENDLTADATVIAAAPSAVNRVLVTATRQVCAIGCPEEVSNAYNPMCIRFSDIEDYDEWTSAPDNNAYEYIVPGGGSVIDGRVFGEDLLFWTNDSLYYAQSTEETTQPWRFVRIASGCGLAAPQAAVVVNQTAYWLTPDLQFFAYQYGGSPVALPCPISRDFKENIDLDQIAKVVAASVGRFNELWWFYPDRREGNENSRYVAVSTIDNSWFKGPVARTSFVDSGAITYPLGVDPDGQSYLHESGNDANGEALSWFIESAPQYVGSGERRVFIRGVWPDFEVQQGDMSMTLKTYSYPQASAVTKGPYALAAGREKRDLRAEGRLVSIRFAGESAPAFMRLGKPSFDAVMAGER